MSVRAWWSTCVVNERRMLHKKIGGLFPYTSPYRSQKLLWRWLILILNIFDTATEMVSLRYRRFDNWVLGENADLCVTCLPTIFPSGSWIGSDDGNLMFYRWFLKLPKRHPVYHIAVVLKQGLPRESVEV